MKILVIQQKRIGDVLLSSIICNNLKVKYPNAVIDFMCHPNCEDVLIGNPSINSIITLTAQTRKSYINFFRFIFKIRQAKYDILIDVYGKLETYLITLFSGSDCKISYYKWYSSLFYNHNINRLKKNQATKYGQAIDNRLLLMEPLNLDHAKINPFPKLYVNQNDDQNVLFLFEKYHIEQAKKIVMISVLGSEKNKTYPLEYMSKIVDFVAEKNVTILFNYLPSQIQEAKKIYDACSKTTQEKVNFDLFAPDLKTFIALMNRCDIIVGNDGGAINIAKALEKPSFTIFSAHVDKTDWAIFEDGIQNLSVHLNDYKPDVLKTLTHKEIKVNSSFLYNQFKPDLFKKSIISFLDSHL